MKIFNYIFFVLYFLCSTQHGIAQLYEAENAQTDNKLIRTENSGYSGSGYRAAMRSVGSYVSFAINNSSHNDYYSITLRYVGGGNTERKPNIYVNNKLYGKCILSGTKTWDNWSDFHISVPLVKGNNTIKFQFDEEGAAYIDIDYLLVASHKVFTFIPQKDKNKALTLEGNTVKINNLKTNEGNTSTQEFILRRLDNGNVIIANKTNPNLCLKKEANNTIILAKPTSEPEQAFQWSLDYAGTNISGNEDNQYEKDLYILGRPEASDWALKINGDQVSVAHIPNGHFQTNNATVKDDYRFKLVIKGNDL